MNYIMVNVAHFGEILIQIIQTFRINILFFFPTVHTPCHSSKSVQKIASTERSSLLIWLLSRINFDICTIYTLITEQRLKHLIYITVIVLQMMYWLYKSFVMSLSRANKKTVWVGKKLIGHCPINVTKWVWMASLT